MFLKNFEKYEVILLCPSSIWKKRVKIISEIMKCYVSICLNGDCLSQNAVNTAMHNVQLDEKFQAERQER
ncbi:hypothetical protein COD11_24325 [Bacillus sp. AFS040349]|nr:hypothetical protein COD11_24325 [Bacillus sp. AFS040349]